MVHCSEKQPVEGRTRMQKMLFLLQQEYKSCDFQYRFHAYDYGPYSNTLQSDVDELIDQGLLQEEPEPLINGKCKYRYSITKKGIKLVEKILAEPKNKKLQLKEIYESSEKIKKYANNLSINELLKDVYSRFPEYTKFSVFEF